MSRWGFPSCCEKRTETCVPRIECEEMLLLSYAVRLAKDSRVWISFEDEELKLVRRTVVLPLVLMHSVSGVWFNALNENDDITPEATQIKDYIAESWAKGKPLQMWHHFDNEGSCTTNNVEEWHGKMNKLCRRLHPIIFALVPLLRQVHVTNNTICIQPMVEDKHHRQRRKYRNIERRLKWIQRQIFKGWDKCDWVRRCSFVFCCICSRLWTMTLIVNVLWFEMR